MTERTHASRRSVLKAVGAAGVGSIAAGAGATTATAQTAHSIPPAEPVDNNPLRGFLPYAGSDIGFPHSMEWFYLPLSDLQVGYDEFDWSALEAELDAVASRGHQAVFRIYLTYPQEPSGIPQFLLDDGLSTTSFSEHGGGVSPDYQDPNLHRALENFLAAFGDRYDGDPRIGFLTAGLLGFWGEWHTYPYDWLTDDVFNLVLQGYDEGFETTPVLARSPKGNAAQYPVGYHDDSFCYTTLPGTDWHFVPTLRSAGVADKWKQQPNGGELRPEIQDTIFEQDPWGSGGDAESWAECVDLVHPTWLLNDAIRRYSGNERADAVQASKQLGYEFRVQTAYFADALGASESLDIGVDVENIGVAPFYYDWDVRVGVKRDGSVVDEWTTDWDLRTVPASRGTNADGGIRSFAFTASDHGLVEGEYTLAIRVVNPLDGGLPLQFANVGQRADGWLDLGPVTVESGSGGDGGDDGDDGTRSRSSLEGTRFTVDGAGRDIWNRTDAFHFVHEGVDGDATLVARVADQENTHPWAKAGVMIRDGLAGDAPHAMMVTTPENGTAFQWRSSRGEQSAHVAGPANAPAWVKLTVRGTTVRGFTSSDGTDWTEVGSTELSPSDPQLGLVVTSHNSGTLGTATFDDVSGWAESLRSDWVNEDVGSTTVAGSVSTGTGSGGDGDGSDGSDGGDETPDQPASLVLDDFEQAGKWPGVNDLDEWAGANSFVNGSGECSDGTLTLQYDSGGWFGSDVDRDVSDYRYLVVRMRGQSGGEEAHFEIGLGGVTGLCSDLSTDAVTTSFRDVYVDMEALGMDRAAPGQLNLTFWHGHAGQIEIESIRFSDERS